MSEVEKLLSRALLALATTKNYAGDDRDACQRISAIYQLLKQWKFEVSEKGECEVSHQEIKKVFAEALELKETPERELHYLLLPGKEEGKGIQLFCFPYAGGMASIFKGWEALLPSWIGVEAIEYPGRGTKMTQELTVSLDALVDHLEQELLSKIKGPFAFFGHSLGAILSFELALRLQEKHKLFPSALFLSACPSPDSFPILSSTKALDDEELIDVLQGLKGTSDQLIETQGFKDFFLPVIRNDFSLIEDYQPPFEKKVNSPLVLLGGKDDGKVVFDDVKKWESWTLRGSSIYEIDGDHFFINHSSDVQGIISSELKKVVACQVPC